MNASAPIGVFDSGIGGLSILRAMRTALPHENLYYVADSGHVPYGSKSPEYLQQRAVLLTQFLLEQDAKALVIACNTATLAAVNHLRDRFPIPIIAVEPAVKPAVAATKTGIVGVIATTATLASAQFSSLLERFGAGVTILTQACPHLVQQVEDGDLSSPATRELIHHYTAPLLAAGADTLVLGCTHYPFLRPLIEDIAGPQVTTIDTSTAVTQQVSRVLATYHLLNRDATGGGVRFWTSGNVESTQAIITKLWEQAASVQPLPPPFA